MTNRTSRTLSDADGIKHELRLHSNTSVERARTVLSNLSSFQRTIAIEHKALIAGTAHVVPLRTLLEEFITFRKTVLRQSAQVRAAQVIDAILWAAGNFAEFPTPLRAAATIDQTLQRLRQLDSRGARRDDS